MFRFIFIGLMLFPVSVYAGAPAAGSEALPATLRQSLEKALATGDAFVINATFKAAAAEHPALTDEITALRPAPAPEQTPPQPEAFTPAVVSAVAPSAPDPAVKPIWQGEITAAFDKESGNTKTETLMMAYTVARESGNWRHKSSGRARFASEDGETINEDYRIKLGSDWKFDDNLFLFGEGEYVSDEFSGFDYRVTESIGLGSRWHWDERKSFFDVRASAGGRHLKETDATSAEHNAIFKPAAELDWHISDRVSLNQKANTTMGTDVTITESETSLNYALNHRLSLKLAFQLEHTSAVPPGTQKTETYTSTGITYKLFE